MCVSEREEREQGREEETVVFLVDINHLADNELL